MKAKIANIFLIQKKKKTVRDMIHFELDKTVGFIRFSGYSPSISGRSRKWKGII